MADAVSRFGLVFYSSTSNAESGIGRMTSAFQSMNNILATMEGTAGRVFDMMKNRMFGLGKEMIDTAGKIEATKASFMFNFSKSLGQEGAEGAFKRAQAAGLRMVQTTNEVIEMATLMKRMGQVNIFDPKIDETFKTIQGAKGDMADLLGDMAAMNPRGMTGVAFAMSAGLTGQWTAFQQRLDISKEKVLEIKKATEGAKDSTERLARMAPFLYDLFGGQAQSMSNTWKFITAQFDDIRDKMFSTLGMPMLDALKPALVELKDFFVGDDGILTQEGRLDGVVAQFKTFGAVLGKIALSAVTFVKGITLFVQAHPGVVKFVVALATGLTVLTGMVAAALALKAAFIAITLASPMVALGAALALGAVLFAKWVVHGKSLADTFDRVKLVGTALMEVLTSLKGDTFALNAETAKALEEKGLLGLVIKLGQFAFRAKEFFGAMFDQFRNNWEMIKSSFLPAFENISTMLGGFGASATTDVEKWTSAGRTLADVLSTVAMWLGRAVSFATQLISTLVEHKTLLLGIATAFAGMKLVQGIGGFAAGLKGGLGGAAGALAGVPPGVTPVWIVGGAMGGGLPGMGGPAGAGGKAMGLLGKAGMVAGAGVAGYAVGTLLTDTIPKAFGAKRGLGELIGDKVFDMFNGSTEERFALPARSAKPMLNKAPQAAPVGPMESTAGPNMSMMPPQTIIVQSVLDGRVVSESVAKHQSTDKDRR